MKKTVLFLLIFILSFLVFETSKKVWVDWKINFFKEKIKPKSFIDEPWMEPLLLKLQRCAPKSPEVWSLSGRYYFRKMSGVVDPKDRLFWIKKTYQSAINAFRCNPFDRFSRDFVNKAFRWKDVLSRISS